MSQKKINGYIIYLKEILGKGSFGMVYRGQQDGTKKSCAVKVLEKSLINHDEYLKSALFSEIQILQMLKSDNIVRVLDVMESSHNYYIIQEICDSDLQRYIDQHRQLSESQSIQFLKQICNGFIALVKQGIVHRDLKPANILLSKGVVKIGDFGFAKKNITKRMKNESSVGTPLYMPIQILKSQPYTSKCDVWAIGCIFYEMLHGKTPWTAPSEFLLVKNIQSQPLFINPNLKPQTKDFIKKCLQVEQAYRLTWDQVFLHPLFENYFCQYAAQNTQFENKLKMVMTQLRFRINSNNINIIKLIQNLGFKQNTQLNYKQFSEFLHYIHSDISKEQVKFFFEQMDSNDDGKISMVQLSAQMQKHYISLTKTSDNEGIADTSTFGVKKCESFETYEQKKISNELQYKVKKCFIKLCKILSTKKLTLYKTFCAYDTNKSGKLSIDEFQKIMKRLDSSFNQEQIKDIFNYMDIDSSKTIEFDELNSYYCKVNGIPESLELPAEYYNQRVKTKI